MCELIQTYAAISVSYLLSKGIQRIAHTKIKIKATTTTTETWRKNLTTVELSSARASTMGTGTDTDTSTTDFNSGINKFFNTWTMMRFVIFAFYFTSFSLFLSLPISIRCFCSRDCSSLNEIYTEKKKRWQKECC